MSRSRSGRRSRRRVGSRDMPARILIELALRAGAGAELLKVALPRVGEKTTCGVCKAEVHLVNVAGEGVMLDRRITRHPDRGYVVPIHVCTPKKEGESC